MANRFHAKSRFRFITNRESERADREKGAAKYCGEIFSSATRFAVRDLIGCGLMWNSCAGVIVETEAYNAIGDEACHCFVRRVHTPSSREIKLGRPTFISIMAFTGC